MWVDDMVAFDSWRWVLAGARERPERRREIEKRRERGRLRGER